MCTDTLVPYAARSSQVLKSEGRVKLQLEAMEIKRKKEKEVEKKIRGAASEAR